MELKGIAHINFTVSDFGRSLPFYKQLFAELGLREMLVSDDYYYCVGRRIGIGIQAATKAYEGVAFDQGRSGLHHYCLAMESREDVDRIAALVDRLGGRIVRAPAANDDWFAGMYSTLMEDPEGIRIEANHLTKQRGR